MMGWIELLAGALTLASVLLAVRLKTALYPVGMAATVLYFVVFWHAKLYASAALQVYFTLVQVYGWWFWLRGAKGEAPPIGDWPWRTVALWGAAAAAFNSARDAVGGGSLVMKGG